MLLLQDIKFFNVKVLMVYVIGASKQMTLYSKGDIGSGSQTFCMLQGIGFLLPYQSP